MNVFTKILTREGFLLDSTRGAGRNDVRVAQILFRQAET
jgi:hypothetical protein